MALADIDKQLLERCLAKQSRAWEDFVDRFLGLVIHVVNHTAESRSLRFSVQDHEDFVAEIFLAILADDFAVLRRFRGESSLATYLTVISRRVVVRELLSRKVIPGIATAETDELEDPTASDVEDRLANREEVQRLLTELPGPEADIVRMYHLEGKSYTEISRQAGIPENSVGPTLSRARAKMRRTPNSSVG